MVSHRSMFAAGIAAAFAVGAHGQTVELLHHSDGESQLIDAGSGLEDFGGIARFATVIANLRADAAVAGGATRSCSPPVTTSSPAPSSTPRSRTACRTSTPSAST